MLRLVSHQSLEAPIQSLSLLLQLVAWQLSAMFWQLDAADFNTTTKTGR